MLNDFSEKPSSIDLVDPDMQGSQMEQPMYLCTLNVAKPRSVCTHPTEMLPHAHERS